LTYLPLPNHHMKAGTRQPPFHYGILSATIPITNFKVLGSTIMYPQVKDFLLLQMNHYYAILLVSYLNWLMDMQ